MNKNIIQKKNILFGIIFKAFSIFLNLLIVPILVFFLGKIEYGVWITIFSIINWILVFDIGIGQGLRNKLTEALSVNDDLKASQIISTSYIIISIFSLVILLIGIGFIIFINFQELLNYDGKSSHYLQNFIFLSLFFTIINFTLSLYKKLYLAVHKSFVIESINVFFQTLYLLFILIWLYFNLERSLISLIIIFGVINFIVSLIATIIFFRMQEKVSFSVKNFNLKEGKLLFKLGGKFFIINISLLVILSTDNLLVSNLLGPSFVTDYAIIQKVFQVLIVIFTVVLSASWGLYSDAIINKDFNWIRENLKKMNFYFLGILFFGLLLFYFIEEILDIWIGKGFVKIPKGLVLCNMLYVFIFCFTNIYMFFINASNKINLQMYIYIFGAVINIPLSILLIRSLNSSTGVILSTLICFAPLLIVMPIQSYRIINKLEQESLKS